MKHIITLFENFDNLSEGSRADFIMHRADEIKKAIKNLHAIGEALEKAGEDGFGPSVQPKLDDRMKVYDTNVEDQIFSWATDPGDVDADAIAEFCSKNQDRWGTEMQMPLYAIQDFYDVLQRAGLITSEEDEEDEVEEAEAPTANAEKERNQRSSSLALTVTCSLF